jgi:hypothetical protein
MLRSWSRLAILRGQDDHKIGIMRGELPKSLPDCPIL